MARCLLVEEGLGCLRVGEGALAMEPKANNQRSLTKSTKGRLVKEIFLSLQQSKGEVLKKKKSKSVEAVEGMTGRGSKLHPWHWDQFLK